MASTLVLSHVRRRLAQSSRHLTVNLKAGYATEGKVKEILGTNEWDNLVNSAKSRPAILDFTASWCPPCKVIAPTFEQLASKHTDVDFVKLDIDNQAISQIVAEFQISSVPTFVSMKAGRKVMSFSGADKAQLKRMVEEVSTIN